MTQYMERGLALYLGSDVDMVVHKALPLGTYTVSFDPERSCFFLVRGKEFVNPKKLYGKTASRVSRFIQTFKDRPGTTGVLLAGAKGSGKTLEMRETAIQAMTQGISTLIVSSPFCGDGFNAFISSIEEPCVVIFDEFEKVYDDEKQERLLTLLDGTIQTKKLVIMTCNDQRKINSHMTNRPGRLFYYLTYTGVSQEFIIEYCEDNLKNKDQIVNICTLAALFTEFNFDMLKALVEELNRYGETVKEAVAILNIRHDGAWRQTYDVKVTRLSDGVILAQKDYYPTSANSPISQDEFYLELYDITKKNAEGDEVVVSEGKDVSFVMHNERTRIKPDLSEIKIENEEFRVVFTKQVRKAFDYADLY